MTPTDFYKSLCSLCFVCARCSSTIGDHLSTHFMCQRIVALCLHLLEDRRSTLSPAINGQWRCSHRQGRSQPHSPGWSRVPLCSFFPQISLNFSYISSKITYFLPHFGLRVGKSPTREGPGYATGHRAAGSQLRAVTVTTPSLSSHQTTHCYMGSLFYVFICS